MSSVEVILIPTNGIPKIDWIEGKTLYDGFLTNFEGVHINNRTSKSNNLIYISEKLYE